MALDYTVPKFPKMSQGTCLLCFSITSVMDIKYSQLRNVYEEISGFKIQADSYPVCYICHTKLLQCEQLLTQIQKLSENQPEATPLVNLSMLKTDSWSVPDNFVEIEWYPDVTREEIHEHPTANVQSHPGHRVLQTDIKIEYINDEYAEFSLGHCKDDATEEPFEDQSDSEPGTTQSDGKTHACDLCTKTFPYLSYLKRHRVVHYEVKPYKCDICNKTFTRISTLKTHKLLHLSDKPYTCEYCKKQFTQIRQFKTHLLIHTNRKPYKCDFCDMQFTQPCNLKAHKQIHSDEKPYSCDVCRKSFKQNCTLTRHKKIHSGGKYHRCDICNKKFTHNRTLNRHRLMHTEVIIV